LVLLGPLDLRGRLTRLRAAVKSLRRGLLRAFHALRRGLRRPFDPLEVLRRGGRPDRSLHVRTALGRRLGAVFHTTRLALTRRALRLAASSLFLTTTLTAAMATLRQSRSCAPQNGRESACSDGKFLAEKHGVTSLSPKQSYSDCF